MRMAALEAFILVVGLIGGFLMGLIYSAMKQSDEMIAKSKADLDRIYLKGELKREILAELEKKKV